MTQRSAPADPTTRGDALGLAIHLSYHLRMLRNPNMYCGKVCPSTVRHHCYRCRDPAVR